MVDMAPDELLGVRIAVVDDDPDVREFVVDCLSSHGASCDAFEDGAAFLAQFPGGSVDLVLLDYAMPGLSGAQVARRAKEIDPHVPVVIMTGYADSDALDDILGDVDVMRKPFSAEALLEAARARVVRL